MQKQMNEPTYYKRGDITMNKQILREAVNKALLKSPALKKNTKLAEAIQKSLEDSFEKTLDLEEAEKKDKKKEKTEVETIEVET